MITGMNEFHNNRGAIDKSFKVHEHELTSPINASSLTPINTFGNYISARRDVNKLQCVFIDPRSPQDDIYFKKNAALLCQQPSYKETFYCGISTDSAFADALFCDSRGNLGGMIHAGHARRY